MQLFQEALPTKLTPSQVIRSFRSDSRPFALVGRWAGSGAIIGSEPVRVAAPNDDPFEVLTRLPVAEPRAPGAVGGGWFGYLGYQLGGSIERLPPPPSRPVPMPHFSLAFYDHVLRYDQGDGRWWFEALWSRERAEALNRRLRLLSARLAAPADPPPDHTLGCFTAIPGGIDHCAAVQRCIDYVQAGDIFQANLCMRLEASFLGDPLDLFCSAVEKLTPAFAGFVDGPWGSVASLSPELFLRREHSRVTTAPIKGTISRQPPFEAIKQRSRLLQSVKDRAENVMIVDLMRNDLGRVCRPGSIRVPSLARAEAHPGVWHLVSCITGTLAQGVDDGALLRATFPPGSVTGAPKVRAMEIISELESTAREVYTGSVGYVSPVAGLELNVAIRSFEFANERVWMGVGGGIVADSHPRSELDECFSKAAPLISAVGGRIEHSRSEAG